jgi:hypothetical protein
MSCAKCGRDFWECPGHFYPVEFLLDWRCSLPALVTLLCLVGAVLRIVVFVSGGGR